MTRTLDLGAEPPGAGRFYAARLAVKGYRPCGTLAAKAARALDGCGWGRIRSRVSRRFGQTLPAPVAQAQVFSRGQPRVASGHSDR